jgi:nucleoside-diphosphate-sugar epimerase
MAISSTPAAARRDGRPTALIAGGSRFIGPALVDHLQRAGYRVTVLNRGNRNSILPAGVETIVCDRKDHGALKRALAGRQWEAVLDTVAYVPEDTLGLLGALDRTMLRHFVHVSTCSVYLPTTLLPIKEHFPRGTQGPGNDYGNNKYLIEELLFGAYRDEGLPVTVVRPGYIYGPRNSVYREAFYFDRLLAGRPLLVPGDGTDLTQFGYVDDLAALMVAVLGNERAVGEAYNFAGEYVVTLAEYFVLAARAVGADFGAEARGGVRGKAGEPCVVYFDPERAGIARQDVRRVFPYKWREHTIRDTEKARVQLGYRESIGLAGGLRESYRWYAGGGRAGSGFATDFTFEDEMLGKLGL